MGLARVGLAVVAGLSAVALGAAGAVLLLIQAVPASVAEGSEVTSLSVVQQQFRDERSVEVSVSIGEPLELSSPGSGRITSFFCEAGGGLVSGSVPLSIDGLPVLALTTGVPLWRDLTVGDAGPDVAALESELARLGRGAEVDGFFGWDDSEVFSGWFEELGDNSVSGLPVARVLWIPAPSVTVSECESAVGAWVLTGEPLATLPGSAPRASITSYPTDLLEGDRVFERDGFSMPVNDDGTITDTAALGTLAALAATGDADNEGSGGFAGTLALTSPSSVSVIPPGSVYDVEGGLGCVVAHGSPVPVRVVGSQLGQTFVTFDGRAPRRIALNPREGAPCR